MKPLKLFGSFTSPYVRRVRIVALELGVEMDWVDTTTAAGQASLRQFNPLWKVPAATVEGEPCFESSQINNQLLDRFGPGPLAPRSTLDGPARNAMAVVDGALDALINAFYLSKDGVIANETSYLQKQYDRAASALNWLEQRVRGPWLTSTEQFGLPEIALLTALDWIRFRDAYPVARHPQLVRCAEEHRGRASVIGTALPSE